MPVNHQKVGETYELDTGVRIQCCRSGCLLLRSLGLHNLVARANSMEERLRTVPCTICGKPVGLKECEVNDLGEPVHETCLAERLKEELKKRTRLSPA